MFLALSDMLSAWLTIFQAWLNILPCFQLTLCVQSLIWQVPSLIWCVPSWTSCFPGFTCSINLLTQPWTIKWYRADLQLSWAWSFEFEFQYWDMSTSNYYSYVCSKRKRVAPCHKTENKALFFSHINFQKS